jgi:hypothetical protein
MTYTTCYQQSLRDKFNKKFKGHVYPFKSGGKGKEGASGHIHKFFMRAIVNNTINIHNHLKVELGPSLIYRKNCEQLAVELLQYCNTLND